VNGVEIETDGEGVVVRFDRLLPVVSSAVVGGGFALARAVVNVHVPKSFRCDAAERVLGDFVRRRAIAFPYIGLLTAAWTQNAEVVTATADGLTATAVVTVGLSNAIGAGRTPAVAWTPSTINAIVVVAATGHGPRCRFGGPVSELGAVVARAVREALGAGVDRWLEEHR